MFYSSKNDSTGTSVPRVSDQNRVKTGGRYTRDETPERDIHFYDFRLRYGRELD